LPLANVDSDTAPELIYSSSVNMQVQKQSNGLVAPNFSVFFFE